MSKLIKHDGFKIDFSDPVCICAFVFDENDSALLTFHGVGAMKRIDIIAELQKSDYYIELKIRKDQSKYKKTQVIGKKGAKQDVRNPALNDFMDDLKSKFRDSYLYRHAEDKIKDKKIIYICLIDGFDSYLCDSITRQLRALLPTGKPTARWQQAIASEFIMLNLNMWNDKSSIFSKFPAERI